jgi:hypothetical protein
MNSAVHCYRKMCNKRIGFVSQKCSCGQVGPKAAHIFKTKVKLKQQPTPNVQNAPDPIKSRLQQLSPSPSRTMASQVLNAYKSKHLEQEREHKSDKISQSQVLSARNRVNFSTLRNALDTEVS